MSKLTTYEDVRRLVTSVQHDLERIREWSLKTGHDAACLAKAAREMMVAIPLCYPDGTGMLTKLQWIEWAKDRLGYPKTEAGPKATGEDRAT